MAKQKKPVHKVQMTDVDVDSTCININAVVLWVIFCK